MATSRPKRQAARAVIVGVAMLLVASCGGHEAAERVSVATRAAASAVATTAPSPTSSVVPTPDVLATATANACPMTPYTGGAVSATGPDGLLYEQAGFQLQLLPDYSGAWYTGGVEAYATSAAAGTLEIDGRRLDGPGTPLRLTKAVTIGDSFDDTLTFDAPGCWELTVKLQGAPEQLQVTVFVQPPTAHPFMVALIAQRNARVPYPPPASCATTPVGEPRLLGSTNGLSVEYTIAGDGLSLRGDPGLLFEGVNELRWAPDPWSAVQVSGAALDDPAQTLRSDMMQSVDAVGEFWRADTLFAVPGCWQLHAVAGDRTLDVTVYVYPAACRPATDGATPSDACHPPE